MIKDVAASGKNRKPLFWVGTLRRIYKKKITGFTIMRQYVYTKARKEASYDLLCGGRQQYQGAYVFAGMLFYALELYADFTGGIDITIGIAEVLGIRVTEKDQVEAAFREAMKSTKTPVIIEFSIDPEDLVYPMIKPGGTLQDLIMDCQKGE